MKTTEYKSTICPVCRQMSSKSTLRSHIAQMARHDIKHRNYMYNGLTPKEDGITQEQADELFYKSHDCISDDPDKEHARIDRWVEDNNIKIK